MNSVIILDLFNILVYLRLNLREKKKSYDYFLKLYDDYPEICIMIIKNRIFKDIGYWKDLYLIWGIINDKKMSDRERYNRYNKLIEEIRASIIKQRLEDLNKINEYLKPKGIINMTKNDIYNYVKENNEFKPDISNICKYCIREKSTMNKKLFWYIDDSLKREQNINYMIRGTLKLKNKNDNFEDYPKDKGVPSGAKEIYRKLNAKVGVFLNIPEMLICSKDIDRLRDINLTKEFKIRNKEFLKKNNIESQININKYLKICDRDEIVNRIEKIILEKID